MASKQPPGPSKQPPGEGSNHESLRKYVLCSDEDCNDKLYPEVRLLPCLHLCCKRCLNEDEAGGDEIRIPEENLHCRRKGCGKRFTYDYLQRDQQAPTERWLSELIRTLQTRDILLRGEEPVCTSCELRPAVAVCRHPICFDIRLCEPCLQYHKDSVKTRGHADDLVPIQRLVQELTQNNNDDDAQPPSGLRTKPPRCRFHGSRLRYYCKRTRQLICTPGAVGFHRDCPRGECLPVEDAICDPEHRPMIVGLKNNVNAKLTELNDALEEVRAIKEDLEDRRRVVEDIIRARRRELEEEIARQTEELLEKVAVIYDTKERRLDSHLDKLIKIQEEVEQSAQFVTAFLDNYVPSPVEFFLLKDHIQTALEKILGNYQSHHFNTDENSVLNYRLSGGVPHGAMGSVSSSPDTENFVTDRPDVEVRPINRPDIPLKSLTVSSVRVTCRDSGDTPVSNNMPSLRAKLVPNADNLGGQDGSENHPDTVDCLVTPHPSMKKYTVSVFPPSVGPHCLWVYQDCPKPIGKRHIYGSPFEVEVEERSWWKPLELPPFVYM